MLKTISLDSEEYKYSLLPGFHRIFKSLNMYYMVKDEKKLRKEVKNAKTIDEVKAYQTFLYIPKEWKELLNKDASKLDDSEIQKISMMQNHMSINSKIDYYLNNDINSEEDFMNAIEIYKYMEYNSPREILLPKLSKKERDFTNFILNICEYGEENIFDYEKVRNYFAKKYIEKNDKADIIERCILWSIKDMNIKENESNNIYLSEGYLRNRAARKKRAMYNARRSNCY